MTDTDHTSPIERLWTPWRLPYIGGASHEEGCIFCNRLAATNDVESLILYRGEHTFVIMNLYPYNTGHIMLVPNQHASDPAELSPGALREFGEMLPRLTEPLRRAFGCDGFNVGLNIGAVAGAGIAQHLHQHIVPRWQGDANFMPILASTMTIPELIPATYAKIRAEIERDRSTAAEASFIVFDRSRQHALFHNGAIPCVRLVEGTPVWKSVLRALPAQAGEVVLAGWAGAAISNAEPSGPVAITLETTGVESLSNDWDMMALTDSSLPDGARERLLHAKALLAPSASR